MPAAKKHASTRRRANRASTHTTLFVADSVDYSSWTISQLKAALRARALKTSGNKPHLIARLADAVADIPELPEREQDWHPKTCELWRDIWTSPMSPEWTESDIHNVYMLASVYDDFWTAESPSARQFAAREYRYHRTSLGLDPLSRRKLEWTIEAAGAAKSQGDKRRAGQTPVEPSDPAPKPGDDPRQHLELAG